MAEYFGLKIEFRDDLPAKNAGYLDPRDEPQYIAVNHNLPPWEQQFTIAHELGHYVLHHNRPRSRRLVWLPDFVDRHCNSRPVSQITKFARRLTFKTFTIEWDADLWALCFFITIGAHDVLVPYLERHPERTRIFFVASIVSFVKAIPRIIKTLVLRFLNLFSLP